MFSSKNMSADKSEDVKPGEYELLLLHLGVETQFYDPIDQNA